MLPCRSAANMNWDGHFNFLSTYAHSVWLSPGVSVTIGDLFPAPSESISISMGILILSSEECSLQICLGSFTFECSPTAS